MIEKDQEDEMLLRDDWILAEGKKPKDWEPVYFKLRSASEDGQVFKGRRQALKSLPQYYGWEVDNNGELEIGFNDEEVEAWLPEASVGYWVRRKGFVVKVLANRGDLNVLRTIKLFRTTYGWDIKKAREIFDAMRFHIETNRGSTPYLLPPLDGREKMLCLLSGLFKSGYEYDSNL